MNKIKLLVVSDDIRLNTGVGIQLRKMLQGLNRTGQYDIAQIGISNFPSKNNIVYESTRIYPARYDAKTDSFGNVDHLTMVLEREKPDILLLFSDPRLFTYIFYMDNVIRPNVKLVLYHTWDNEPFPKFNLPWYSACDYIVMLSRFSYNLLQENNINCTFIPHGYDPSEFYRLHDDIIQKQRLDLIKSAGKTEDEINFIVFWNNRNITRKRPGDIIRLFSEFSKKYPSSLLLIKSAAIDHNGTDLLRVAKDLHNHNSSIVLINEDVTSTQLNLFYNVADVSINIAHTEGFGLCVGESLLAETPVIATYTGGMIEQLNGVEIVSNTQQKISFGCSIKPAAKELFGVVHAPYIYQDYVSDEAVIAALKDAYNNREKWKELGKKGREHIIAHYPIDNTIKLWHAFLQKIHADNIVYKPWHLTKCLSNGD